LKVDFYPEKAIFPAKGWRMFDYFYKFELLRFEMAAGTSVKKIPT
jgi:hypothetical protein